MPASALHGCHKSCIVNVSGAHPQILSKLQMLRSYRCWEQMYAVHQSQILGTDVHCPSVNNVDCQVEYPTLP